MNTSIYCRLGPKKPCCPLESGLFKRHTKWKLLKQEVRICWLVSMKKLPWSKMDSHADKMPISARKSEMKTFIFNKDVQSCNFWNSVFKTLIEIAYWFELNAWSLHKMIAFVWKKENCLQCPALWMVSFCWKDWLKAGNSHAHVYLLDVFVAPSSKDSIWSSR